MKRILAFFTILTISLSMMAQNDSTTLNRVGDKAPSFVCKTIDGKEINTKELKGKVIWINFFATWCPPCKKELPVLQKNVYEKYRNNKDFVLVVVGREHTTEELVKFAEEKEYDLPFAPDVGRKIFSLYATQSIPRNVIIDKKGKISFQSSGYTEEEFKRIEDHVAGLLK